MVNKVMPREQGVMKLSERTSLRISAISFIASICVVLQHFGNKVILTGGLNSFYKYGISHGVADFPVSFFFAVSGFFVVKHFSSFNCTWWGNELRKRVFSLLIPYLVWCSLQWVICYFFESSREGVLQAFGLSSHLPIMASFWYLKNLFLFCLALPAFIWIARWFSARPLWCLGVVFCLVHIFPFPAKRSFVMGGLYFTCGIYMGLGGAREVCRVANWFSKHFFLLLGVFCAIVALRVWTACSSATWAETARWILVPLSLFVVWIGYDCVIDRVGANIKSRFHRAIMRQSFFVFCFHGIVLRRWLCGDWMGSIGQDVVGAIALPLCVVAVSVTLGYAIERMCPKLRVMLCGGR